MKALQLRPTTFELKTAAKFLGISHIALTSELRDRGILQPSGHGLVPTAAHEKSGNFLREPRVTHSDRGIPRHYVVTLVTVQGLAWLATELKKEPAKAA